jgi:hypothetical protein
MLREKTHIGECKQREDCPPKEERFGYKSGWSDTSTDWKNEKMMVLA